MKSAYLTIDDSPSLDMPQKVDFLYRNDIPAVFFCRGDFMEKYPDFILDTIKKGYPIANHSYSHPHFSDIDIEQVYQEIKQTDEIIDQLYEQSGVVRPARWFRFPFGDKGDGRYGKVLEPLRDKKGIDRRNIIQAILRGMSYTQPHFPAISYRYFHHAGLATDADWHWTYDTMEWSMSLKKPLPGLQSLSDLVKRMEEEAPKDPRGEVTTAEARWLQSTSDEIILLHDHTETSEIFEGIIEAYRRKGIQFLPFEPLFD